MRGMVTICLSVTLLFAITASAYAGNRPGAVTVSPFIGGYTFDGDQHLRTMPVYGVRGGYNFTRHWGTEALFSYVRTETTATDKGTDAYRYGLDALYHFMPDQKLVPFVAAGFGGTTIDFPAGTRDITAGLFNYGPGLKYFLTDGIALRGDLRHLLILDRFRNNLEYTVGAVFQFGGKKPAARPVEATPPPAPPAPVEAPLPPIPAAEPTTPETSKYCITLNILFDINRTEVRPQYHDEVGKVATFMRRYPATTAVIEGHTDDVGTDEYNMDLSQHRAASVVDYLVEKFGIERNRLAAKGYGKTRPLTSDRSEEGRQKNRRIEAIIDCAIDLKGIKPAPDKICKLLRLQFDTNNTDIKARYHDELADIAEFMKENPQVTGVVEGHTDNVGPAENNLKLSQRRAESVVDYLVEKFGIDRSRLSAKGYGETRRIAYNSTAEGREKNRRVTVVLDCAIRK